MIKNQNSYQLKSNCYEKDINGKNKNKTAGLFSKITRNAMYIAQYQFNARDRDAYGFNI